MKEIKREYSIGADLSYSSMRMRRNDILQATLKIFGSWKNTLKETGIDYNDFLYENITTSLCGGMFEKVGENILNDLDIEGSVQKRIKINGKVIIPDFVTPKNTFYDFKLSEWSIYNSRTLKKYEPNCKLLTVIYLQGNPERDEMISNKTRIVSVHQIIKQLPKERRIHYFRLIEDIEEKVKSIS
jgi:hypothetical protein